MDIENALNEKKEALAGATVTDAQTSLLRQKLPQDLRPDWYTALLGKFPLIGVSFSLDEERDRSGMGAELRWLSPEESILEALEMYPGKSVAALGYLPVGACLSGSGDPYFLKMEEGSRDPALVRVPHEPAAEESYPEEAIELVSPRLSEFFEHADIG